MTKGSSDQLSIFECNQIVALNDVVHVCRDCGNNVDLTWLASLSKSTRQAVGRRCRACHSERARLQAWIRAGNITPLPPRGRRKVWDSPTCVTCGVQRDMNWFAQLKLQYQKSTCGQCKSCFNERHRLAAWNRKGIQPPPPPGVARQIKCVKCAKTFTSTVATASKCGLCGGKCDLNVMAKDRMSLTQRQCEWCSKSFTTNQPQKRFCVRRCKITAREVRLGRRSDPRVDKPIARKPGPRSSVWYLHCVICDKLIACRQANRKYCSNACQRQNICNRLMGLYHTALVQIDVKSAMHWQRQICAYLADRDGNKCGICCQMVDMHISSGTRGSDLGPSIDHVVPRSQGGSDDLANLRLTHWGCNRKRGNRGGNEQLRLIG